MLKELIKAIYAIAKAIKGESGGGDNSNINSMLLPFVMPNKIGARGEKGLKIFDNIEQLKNDNEVDNKQIFCLYEKIENFEENYEKYFLGIKIYDGECINFIICNKNNKYVIQSVTNYILNNENNKDYYVISQTEIM